MQRNKLTVNKVGQVHGHNDYNRSAYNVNNQGRLPQCNLKEQEKEACLTVLNYLCIGNVQMLCVNAKFEKTKNVTPVELATLKPIDCCHRLQVEL